MSAHYIRGRERENKRGYLQQAWPAKEGGGATPLTCRACRVGCKEISRQTRAKEINKTNDSTGRAEEDEEEQKKQTQSGCKKAQAGRG